MKVLGLLIAAVPFAFAGIRLFVTGSDMRYLWMAVVSTLVAVVLLARSPDRSRPGLFRIAIATTAVTACVALMSVLLGARAPFGIVIVSISIALCSSLGIAAVVRSRAKETE